MFVIAPKVDEYYVFDGQSTIVDESGRVSDLILRFK